MKLKILVVDDDVSVRYVISELLESRGYVVVQACDGQDAANILLRHNDISLVLTDLQMPHMSGLELSHFVRKLHRPTPLIIMSAHLNASDKAQALSLGADLFKKPFQTDALLRRIQELLEQSRAA